MFGFGKQKPKSFAEFAFGGKLPKELEEKLGKVADKLIERLEQERPSEEELKEIFSRPAKFLIDWDGKNNLRVEVDGNHGMFEKFFIEAIKANPALLPVFQGTVAEVEHRLECDCENCTEWATEFHKNEELRAKEKAEKEEKKVKKSKKDEAAQA